MVVFPNVLLSKMNVAIGRIGTMKNHQEFIKIALMYMFSWEKESMRHEQRMADFVSSEDIKREVEKLRDLLNDGQGRPGERYWSWHSAAIIMVVGRFYRFEQAMSRQSYARIRGPDGPV